MLFDLLYFINMTGDTSNAFALVSIQSKVFVLRHSTIIILDLCLKSAYFLTKNFLYNHTKLVFVG